MDDIFISYAREDALFAKVVRGRLAEEGFATWLDLDRLRAGEDWSDEIDLAIRDSLALIALITPEAGASAYFAYEWAFAAGAGVKVIPLLLRPTVDLHPRLRSRQHFDFTDRAALPWLPLIEELRRVAAARQRTTVPVPRDAPPVVQQAVAALDSLDPEQRGAAVESLGRMRHASATEALAGAARHPLPEVRIAATREAGTTTDMRCPDSSRPTSSRAAQLHVLVATVALSGSELCTPQDERADARLFAAGPRRLAPPRRSKRCWPRSDADRGQVAAEERQSLAPVLAGASVANRLLPCARLPQSIRSRSPRVAPFLQDPSSRPRGCRHRDRWWSQRATRTSWRCCAPTSRRSVRPRPRPGEIREARPSPT
jgi:hypothetical protein